MKQHPIHIYHPLYTLKAVSNNIWIVDGDLIEMNIFGVKVPFSTRMTVVQLSDGTLWCHSPVQPTPELLAELNAIGEVTHLISPNKIHYAYISEWQKHYPNALAWASPGVQERATKKGIHIHFKYKLCQAAPPEWQKDIEQ